MLRLFRIHDHDNDNETSYALVGLERSALCPPLIHENTTPPLEAYISIARKTTIQKSFNIQTKLIPTIQRNELVGLFLEDVRVLSIRNSIVTTHSLSKLKTRLSTFV